MCIKLTLQKTFWFSTRGIEDFLLVRLWYELEEESGKEFVYKSVGMFSGKWTVGFLYKFTN
jgi:hypothetical protein